MLQWLLFILFLFYLSISLFLLLTRLWCWIVLAPLPARIIWKFFLSAFAWPKELLRLGPMKFFWCIFLNRTADEYDRKKFEKSSLKAAYGKAAYHVYETTPRRQPDHILPEGPGNILIKHKDRVSIAVIIAWFPHIGRYQVMCQHLLDVPCEFQPDDLDYTMDSFNQKKLPLESLSDCLENIGARGLQLPEKMIESLKTIHIANNQTTDQRVTYYNWQGLKKSVN